MNQRELGHHLGLSQSTVSLALRGSPRIAEATRRQIQTAAAELGYHPNPMVISLMEHIRSARPVKDAGCIAILVDFPNQEQWFAFHPAYREQYDAIYDRAEQRGYRTECFFLQAPGMNPAAIDRILAARGIVGIILAGPRTSCVNLKMQWGRYAWIKSGFTWHETRMDCVSANNRQHVELAFRELDQLKYARIGFCITQRMIRRVDSHWVAGYLMAQRLLTPKRRIPMFVTDPNAAGQARFRAWLNRWKPDVVIGGRTEQGWIERSRGLRPSYCLRWHYEDCTVPSIEENNLIIGRTLCDLLIEKMIRNERGLPEHPRLTLIEGTWCNPCQGITV